MEQYIQRIPSKYRPPIQEKYRISDIIKEMETKREERMVQSVRCPKCDATFMGSIVPYCYESPSIQKEVAKYLKLGCKIELIDVEDFEFEVCECKLG